MLAGCMGFTQKARCYFGFSWAEFQGDGGQQIMLKLKALDFSNGGGSREQSNWRDLYCTNCAEKQGILVQRCGSPHLKIQRHSQKSTCLTRSGEKFNSLCVFWEVVC